MYGKSAFGWMGVQVYTMQGLWVTGGAFIIMRTIQVSSRPKSTYPRGLGFVCLENTLRDQ